MTAVALRGILSRKVRTALTMIAILLGVAMISGTYVLTDTINAAFSQIFHQANSTTDVVIQGKQKVQSQFNSLPPSFPQSLLAVVQGTPGVAKAAGEISDLGQLVDKNGKSLSATQGAPSLLLSHVPPPFTQLRIVQGRFPHGNEIVVDKATVTRHHLRLGQQVGLVTVGAVHHVTIVGVVKFQNINSLGGASIVGIDLPTAQRFTGKQGELDVIRVQGASGVDPSELVRRIEARIPPTLRNRIKVETGQQNANAQTSSITNALSPITNILLAFGIIAIFVGAFVIFNTFSITVAQRTREFALLRTIGATRGQVLRSVVVEALVVGFLASVVGLFAGLGIARGLNALFSAIGADLPGTAQVVQTRTAVVALLVGTIVTLVASLWPAIRATRVPPVAALREGVQLPRGRLSRFTPLIAAILTLVGLVVLILGVFASISDTGQRLTVIGLGCLLLFVGVAMLSPQLVPPLALAIGWPIERLTAITGRLARENTVRNPSRTAVTAAALMVGLALVGFVTIFAAELKQTADDALTREIAGTYTIYSDANQLIPAGVAAAAARVPGVTGATSVKIDAGQIAGIGTVQTNGIQPTTFGQFYHFQWIQGSNATVANLGPYGAIVDENLARDHHLHLGSVLRVTTPAGTHAAFTVHGIYKHSQFLTDWVVPYATMRQVWRQPKDFAVLVNAAPGQNVNALKARLTKALSVSYPTAAVHSEQDFKAQEDKSINQLLVLIYVLLAMSVLVSLFGIINTLVLSVYERTREIGLLRAIGTTRRQVRWMVRWESVITSVIGAILGLLLGIVLALLVTKGLESQGLEYTVPVGQLLIFVVFAVVFGVVAAAWPARRAARLDVLQAVAYE